MVFSDVLIICVRFGSYVFGSLGMGWRKIKKGGKMEGADNRKDEERGSDVGSRVQEGIFNEENSVEERKMEGWARWFC